MKELTIRQLEVLRLLARGFARKEIAEKLDISPHTVRAHCEGILTRTDCHTMTDAILKAVKEGLVEL